MPNAAFEQTPSCAAQEDWHWLIGLTGYALLFGLMSFAGLVIIPGVWLMVLFSVIFNLYVYLKSPTSSHDPAAAA